MTHPNLVVEVYAKEFQTVVGPSLRVTFCSEYSNGSRCESTITFLIDNLVMKFRILDLLQLRKQMDFVLNRGDQWLEQIYDNGFFGIRGELVNGEQSVKFTIRKEDEILIFQLPVPSLLRDETHTLELIEELLEEPHELLFDGAFALCLFDHHYAQNETKANRWYQMTDDHLRVEVKQQFEIQFDQCRVTMVKICQAFSIPNVMMVERFTEENLFVALKHTLGQKIWKNTRLCTLLNYFS